MIGATRVSDAKARASLAADCTLALTTLGFSKTMAKKAVGGLTIKPDASLEVVMRAALQSL